MSDIISTSTVTPRRGESYSRRGTSHIEKPTIDDDRFPMWSLLEKLAPNGHLAVAYPCPADAGDHVPPHG